MTMRLRRMLDRALDRKRARLRESLRAVNFFSLRTGRSIERLEDRRMLATYVWDGEGLDDDWNNPVNWDVDSLPTATDDAIIGAAFAGRTILVSDNVSVQSIQSDAAIQVASGQRLTLGSFPSLLTDVVLSSGAVLALNSGATLNASSLQMSSASQLELEVVGGTSGLFPVIDVAGSVNIDGTLRIDLDLGIYLPQRPEVLTPLLFANRVGDFDVVEIPQAAGSPVLDVRWNGADLSLEANRLFVQNTNDSGPGSMREAILTANSVAGPDKIHFLTDGIISLLTPLARISEQTEIDGTTAPGYVDRPVVEVTSNWTGTDPGIWFFPGSDGSVLRGMSIHSIDGSSVSLGDIGTPLSNILIERNHLGLNAVGDTVPRLSIRAGVGMNQTNASIIRDNVISGNVIGVYIQGDDSFGNIVVRNKIGTNRDGTAALPNADGGFSWGGIGVRIEAGANYNAIGGVNASDRNLISGNQRGGIIIKDPGTTNNTISGNWIGVDVSGTNPLPNGGDGILIENHASNNEVGGPLPGQGNVISGNDQGIRIAGNAVPANTVSWWRGDGNATDVLGQNNGIARNVQYAAGPTEFQAFEFDGLSSVDLGQDAPLGTTGNMTWAMWVWVPSVVPDRGGANYDARYFVGDADALGGIVQSGVGMWSDRNEPGTPFRFFATQQFTNASPQLFFSNATMQSQRWYHVAMVRDTTSQELKLYIDGQLDKAESYGSGDVIPLSNNKHLGVSRPWPVGTPNPDYFVGRMADVFFADRALDQHELQRIVELGGSALAPNEVIGNRIGTDPSGTTSIAGQTYGVTIEGSGNRIGGATSNHGNILGGNTTGVWITGPSSTANIVSGNTIGTNSLDSTTLANQRGVVIDAGANGNLIGGSTAASKNLISRNNDVGVLLSGSSTSNNSIRGNWIGLNNAGNGTLGGQVDGIRAENSASNNTIGGSLPGQGNVISGNQRGVNLATDNLPEGVVSWWRGDGNATDVIGNNSGVGYGVSYSSGPAASQAFQFSGDDFIDLGNDPSLNQPGSVTWSMWVNVGDFAPDPGPYDSSYVIGDFNAGGNFTQGGMGIWSSAGGPYRFFVTQNTADLSQQSINGTTDIVRGQWYHIAFVRDDVHKTLKLYVNGEVEGTVTYSGSIIGIQSNKYLGVSHPVPGLNYDFFHGKIADVALLNRSLSEKELQDIYKIRGGAIGQHVVLGNRIGTNVSGTAPLGVQTEGIRIEGSGNIVGGSVVGSGNLISGNTTGVAITGTRSFANSVVGNWIGTDASGTSAIPNNVGALIEDGAKGNQIGGSGSNSNLISGNNQEGILVVGSATRDNLILGNRIGTNAAGNRPLPNAIGIRLDVHSTGNTIGGSDSEVANTISGNLLGIDVASANVTADMLHWWKGDGTTNDSIGTSTAISVQGLGYGPGVSSRPAFFFDGTDDYLDLGNHSSFDRPGSVTWALWFLASAVPNSTDPDEVRWLVSDLDGSQGELTQASLGLFTTSGLTTISFRQSYTDNSEDWFGGVTEIQANQWYHVAAVRDDASKSIQLYLNGVPEAGRIYRGKNVVSQQGNYVAGRGIANALVPTSHFAGRLDDLAMASRALEQQEIARIYAAGGEALGSTSILGNRIGTDITASLDLGNSSHGIWVRETSVGTLIGTDAPSARNLISGNDEGGIRIEGSRTWVRNNWIGTNGSGNSAIPNSGSTEFGGYGIQVTGPSNVVEQNTVSGNDGPGIWLSGDRVARTSVVRNLVGVGGDTSSPLGNSIGILLNNQAAETWVGYGGSGMENVVAYNRSAGLSARDSTSLQNAFGRNRYFGNAVLAIDIGMPGTTLNDPDDVDGSLNAPVLTEAALVGNEVWIKGFVGAGKTVEFYASAPTASGYGSGRIFLGAFQEGVEGVDFDTSVGSYGPVYRGLPIASATVTSNRFEFRFPLLDRIGFGSLLTSLADGSTSEFGNTIQVGDVASNLAPEITLAAAMILKTGQTFQAFGSFTDEDSTEWTATVDYGDDSGPLPLQLKPDRTFVLENTYTESRTTPFQVVVRITDGGNKTGTKTMLVTVENEGPLVTVNEFTLTREVQEGGIATLSGVFADSGAGDQHTVTIDWGDGSVVTYPSLDIGTRTFEYTHVYEDDGVRGTPRDAYRVLVTVTDQRGASSTTPAGLYVVEVVNQKPILEIVEPNQAWILEGLSYEVQGLISDAGILDEHVLTIDWGDGSPTETVTSFGQSNSFLQSHFYRNNPDTTDSTYVITLSVYDDDEPAEPTIITRTVEVRNVVPSFIRSSVSPGTIDEGGTVSLNLEVADPGIEDRHFVRIDWGDGSPTQVVQRLGSSYEFPLISHRFLNDPPSGNGYQVQIRLYDDDMDPSGPGILRTLPISVTNVAPQLTSVQWFVQNASGDWLPISGTIQVHEGMQIRVAGQYQDPGISDSHVVDVSWPGGFAVGSVDPVNRTFEAILTIDDDRYRDGSGAFTQVDTITVRVQDDDGASATIAGSILVQNVAPSVNVLPGVIVDPDFIPLSAEVFDPSLSDVANLIYSWTATGTGGATTTSGGSSFSLDRTVLGSGSILLRLDVSDDDGGVGVFESVMLFGTTGPDTIQVSNSSFQNGVTTLMALSLDGDDIIDASGVTDPTLTLILDGGVGTDNLFGGAGDDIFILRSGDDSANVANSQVTNPVFAGNDRYLLVPNSTLTLIDDSGDNTIDFSLADFGSVLEPNLGVTFDLSRIPTTTGSLIESAIQDVAFGSLESGAHFVHAQGLFNRLVGSGFDDSLTTKSDAVVLAGAGSDKLFIGGGITGGFVSGGADSDVFNVAGTITSIRFEGDSGADVFNVTAGSLSGIVFRGGADNDDFIVGDAVTQSQINLQDVVFEGDAGADDFFAAGSITGIVFRGGADNDVFNAAGTIGSISFEGDSGADVFHAGGSIASVVFRGGADNDVFNATESFESTVSVEFEGDWGADEFNAGGSIASIVFRGGADNDVFNAAGSIGSIRFEGDSGADVFDAGGTVSSIFFHGGADNDVFNTSGSITSISFEGDSGADVFNAGGSIASIIFSGGADKDEFRAMDGLNVSDRIEFNGDSGDDVFNAGGTIASIVFRGGADNDVFSSSGTITSINFEGDTGADVFNAGGSLSKVIFRGGADDDRFNANPGLVLDDLRFINDFNGLDNIVGPESLNEGLWFEGDAGDDVLNLGGSISQIVFRGGADNDVFHAAGSIGAIRFEGDTGADVLDASGTITQILFRGGADNDVFSATGTITSISFEGDSGADVLYTGGKIASVMFRGGADNDVFSASGKLSAIRFEGDAGADVLYAAGEIGSIVFRGGADSDRFIQTASDVDSIEFYGFTSADVPAEGIDGVDLFVNRGNDIRSLLFEGDAGADVFVVEGSSIASIVFRGGADGDVLLSAGNEIGAIWFEGDAAEDAIGGNDTFVNRSSFDPKAAGAARGKVHFFGGAGIDAFRNDGNDWDSVTFIGGDGADAFQNNGNDIDLIAFQGGNGSDVIENNGNAIGAIAFAGGAGRDLFFNDGFVANGIGFIGGTESDILVNTAARIRNIVYEGGDGDDDLLNLGTEVQDIVFDGGNGIDRLINTGSQLRDVLFVGGAGTDAFYNRPSAIQSRQLVFVPEWDPSQTQSPLVDLTETGLTPYDASTERLLDQEADLFLNEAASVSDIHWSAGAGSDFFQNEGDNVTSVHIHAGSGNDSILNLGAKASGWLIAGDQGDDIFENRGALLQGLEFHGGLGNDTLSQRGIDVTEVFFAGGDGTDVLVNWSDRAETLTMHGDQGDDRFQNNGSDVSYLVFQGGEGNDALQNNGNLVRRIDMLGSDGADSLFNNGSDIGQIVFDGGDGADALINTGNRVGIFDGGQDGNPLSEYGVVFLAHDGADLARINGRDIRGIHMVGGAGNDSLIWNALSIDVREPVWFDAGEGNDILTFRGSASSLHFEGGEGDDSVVYSGLTPYQQIEGPSVNLLGGVGSDRYEFIKNPQGWIQIDDPVESEDATSDTSRDRLDFSAYISGAIHLDLEESIKQELGNLFAIQFTAVTIHAIEDVIGTAASDTIQGNNRSNFFSASRFFTDAQLEPVPASQRTQWVFLDFDSETAGSEYVYTTEDRNAILARLRGIYYGYRVDGTPRDFTDPDRWFNVRFTLSSIDIPEHERVTGQFVTIRFNDTPGFGNPGGDASEIDLGNQNFGGLARVQINGLLGGITLPSKRADFMEELPEDAEQTFGQQKPPATVENFIALSTKIAAHELAHLLGLRHYDAFGPIGYGIHSPPGAAAFKPQYQGLSAAFETFDHLIGSPASVGTTRFNDIGQLFFGEREAVKLAFAMSDPGHVFSHESIMNSLSFGGITISELALRPLSVPNTLSRGMNAEKNFRVLAASVEGQIERVSPQPEGTETSESDYYGFVGRAGELVTIEVASRAMRRFTETQQSVDGYIDSVLRLWMVNDAGNRSLVQTFGQDAINDDEFESSDSLLMDIELPRDGQYIIEVDTFTRGPRDGDPTESELQLLPPDLRKKYLDMINDTDIGRYQLFVYTFDRANQTSEPDILVGRGGVDFIEGTIHPSHIPAYQPHATSATVLLGRPWSQNYGYIDLSGESWTATLTKDGSTVNLGQVEPNNGVTLNQTFDTSGVHTLILRITNDDNVSIVTSIYVEVLAVEPSIGVVTASPKEGSSLSMLGILSERVLSLGTFDATWTVTRDGESLTQHGNGFAFSFVPNDSGEYVVEWKLTDAFGISESGSQSINVANVPPTFALDGGNQVEVSEGSRATLEVTNVFDPGSADMLGGFTYEFDFDNDGVFEVVSDAPSITIPDTLLDDGPRIRTFGIRVSDKDSGVASAIATYAIRPVAPSVTVNASASVVRGSVLTLTLNATDPSQADTSEGFTFAIDWEGDGLFEQTVKQISGTTVEGTYWTIGSRMIQVKATDKDGIESDVFRFHVDVLSTENGPSVILSGPTTALADTPIVVQATITDADAFDVPQLINAWSVTLNGIVQTSGTSTNIEFRPTQAGEYRINFTSTDPEGLVGEGVHTIIVSPPVSSVTIDGTAANDSILLDRTTDGSIRVRVNGVLRGTYAAGTTMIVNGLNGNDTITVASSITSPVEINGGDGNDLLTGGSGKDRIDGGPGDDILVGGNGEDHLIGGPGNDVFRSQFSQGALDQFDGGDGMDVIEQNRDFHRFASFSPANGIEGLTIINPNNGTRRVDGIGVINNVLDFSGILYVNGQAVIDGLGLEIRARDGNDTVIGTAGDDTIFGGIGNDTLIGGDGNDTIHGNGGIDEIHGGEGNDVIHGGAGVDAVFGGPGDDVFIANFSDHVDDMMNGGEGINTLRLNPARNPSDPIRLKRFSPANQIQRLEGGSRVAGTSGDDVLDFSAVAIWTTGRRIDSENGNDSIIAPKQIGLGGFEIHGGNGNDLIIGSPGDDRIDGGAGVDRIFGELGNDLIRGGSGMNELYGGEGFDTFYFHDIIEGRFDQEIRDFSAEDRLQFKWPVNQTLLYGAVPVSGRFVFDRATATLYLPNGKKIKLWKSDGEGYSELTQDQLQFGDW